MKGKRSLTIAACALLAILLAGPSIAALATALFNVRASPSQAVSSALLVLVLLALGLMLEALRRVARKESATSR
jgi:hypothetical protein